ncbi:hypothetical protein JCM5353_004304 [Sporobolomyces roseus]
MPPRQRSIRKRSEPLKARANKEEATGPPPPKKSKLTSSSPSIKVAPGSRSSAKQTTKPKVTPVQAKAGISKPPLKRVHSSAASSTPQRPAKKQQLVAPSSNLLANSLPPLPLAGASNSSSIPLSGSFPPLPKLYHLQASQYYAPRLIPLTPLGGTISPDIGLKAFPLPSLFSYSQTIATIHLVTALQNMDTVTTKYITFAVENSYSRSPDLDRLQKHETVCLRPESNTIDHLPLQSLLLPLALIRDHLPSELLKTFLSYEATATPSHILVLLYSNDFMDIDPQ